MKSKHVQTLVTKLGAAKVQLSLVGRNINSARGDVVAADKTLGCLNDVIDYAHQELGFDTDARLSVENDELRAIVRAFLHVHSEPGLMPSAGLLKEARAALHRAPSQAGET